jgi:pSer/pThr/pTyr-binding forkhead associated (FHA) protein
MPRLVLLSEGFSGRSYELKVETTTVGRVSDNAFEIPEASVSSHHAEIILRGHDVVIRDLGSTNGTFINGEKITEAVLKPGQTLRFGTIDLKLDTGDGVSNPGAAGISGVPSAPKKPKQSLDQTVIIPQGVKLDELGGAGGPPNLGNTTGFEKKRNRGGKVFAIMAIVALILLGALAWVLFKNQ